jgi:acid stress-induced BolA-like protein IbaG/YrbA
MKLSIVSQEKASDIVPFISRYANSQNKVTEADLFSNHPFHIRFEQFSRKITPHPKPGFLVGERWFYERARGQYVNEQAYMTKAERVKFQTLYPKQQLITKTSLAKYINSFEKIPFVVSKGAEFNFGRFADNIAKLWESSEANINEGFYKASIAKAIIFKTIENLIASQKGSWYLGHRDKLVPYTISYVANALSRHSKEIDYDLIWRKQAVPQELQDLYLKVAERVNTLMHASDRPFGNVAEYAKREVFWNVVKSDSSTLDISSIEQSTIGTRELRDTVFYERLNQTLRNNQDLAVSIKAITPEKWANVEAYVIDTNQDNPAKLTLIRRAATRPNSLTDHQCKALNKILTDYESHFRG